MKKESGEFIDGQMGRTNIVHGCTGPLHIFARAAKNHTGTVMAHANDLTQVLKKDKEINPTKSNVLIV